MNDSGIEIAILALLFGILLFVFLLRYQSKLNNKEVPLKNSDNKARSINSPKSESQILVSDDVVELNLSKEQSAEKDVINKPTLVKPKTEKINIYVKGPKLKNGLKQIEITIPNLNSEPTKSADVHSLRTTTKSIPEQIYSSIPISKVSLSQVHKGRFIFLLIKNNCLTIMNSEGEFICEEWKYRQPSTGSEIEALISRALIDNTVFYYGHYEDYDGHEIKLNEVVNRLNSVTITEIGKLKICSLFNAYKSFIGKRSFKFTYITNILKNEGLLEYGKQPDSPQIYCERLALLKNFLETNKSSLSVIGDGLDLKCDLTRAYSNIINELDDESIIHCDYDNLYCNRELIGKIKLSDSELLYEQSELLYLRKGQTGSPNKILAINSSHKDYLYFLDKRTEQYHAEINKRNSFKVKKSLMDINLPKFSKKTFQVSCDHLSTDLTEKQNISVKYLDVQHYLKQNVFRVDFINSNGQLVISTSSSSKAFIEAIKLSLYANHEIEVASITGNKVKLVISNLNH